MSNSTSPNVTNTQHLNQPYTGQQNQKLAIQWNLRGLRASMDELKMMIAEEKHLPIALALQEIMTSDKTNYENLLQKRYKWYPLVGPSPHKGGVCIALLENITHIKLQIKSPLQISAIRIKGPQQVSLASIYISPTHRNTNIKNEIVEIIKQLPPPFLIMGDFNAKHTAWGGKQCNARGKMLLEIIEEHNLAILNDGQHTRFNSCNGSTSAIDLSISTWDFAPKVRWFVDKDLRGSDHFPIHIRTTSPNPQINLRKRWLYESANWSGFVSTVSRLLVAKESFSIEEITEAIYIAAEANISRTTGKSGKKAVPWWNDEVKQAIKTRRKALRSFKRLPDDSEEKKQALTNFQTARKRSREVVAKAKLKSWEEFLDGISPQSSTTELWRKVNALSGKRRTHGYSLDINGTSTDEPNIVAEHLVNHFARISSSSNYKEEFIQKNQH